MIAGDKPRRPVSDEEAALWRSVTRTISPLQRRRADRDSSPGSGEAKSTNDSPRPAPPAAATPRRNASKPKEPALAPMDRRSRQRLARGTESIDARLDLHGRTQSQAHGALLRFLQRAQADGARTVLVITGKGGTGERGVLRRQVPLWLALPEFRTLVVGFDEAGVRHGREGALYVRVRRPRG
jgi:DNA-nicking Smr family endonuclease